MFSKIYFKDKEINDSSKYSLAKDVTWASPKGFDLTMDIYTPKKNQETYPVLAIFHGGGFLVRRKEIMNNMAQYIASNHDYVVCNINYRLLGDQKNTVAFNEIINDAFGSVLWIKENIVKYKGDKEKVAVTGDSAGAYLSAMILNSGDKLGDSDNFYKHLSFEPSYIPENISLKEISMNKLLDVQAAILNYGGYDFYNACLKTGAETYKNPFWWMAFSKPRGIFGSKYNLKKNSDMYKAVSPIFNIPDANQRQLPPQLLTGASKDRVTPVKLIQIYLNKLKNKGQKCEYWEHEGRGHAYLDSGKSFLSGNDFKKDAIPALEIMVKFLNSIFY
jgi:acetyl esterase/lipase